jgi:hypothetical protein
LGRRRSADAKAQRGCRSVGRLNDASAIRSIIFATATAQLCKSFPFVQPVLLIAGISFSSPVENYFSRAPD